MISREDEQKMKEKLLQSLIDHMDDLQGDRMKPRKAMTVEVAAPDKEKLLDGLSKARDLMAKDEIEPDQEDHSEEESPEHESDEARLMDLAGEDEDEDEDDERPMRRW